MIDNIRDLPTLIFTFPKWGIGVNEDAPHISSSLNREKEEAMTSSRTLLKHAPGNFYSHTPRISLTRASSALEESVFYYQKRWHGKAGRPWLPNFLNVIAMTKSIVDSYTASCGSVAWTRYTAFPRATSYNQGRVA